MHESTNKNTRNREHQRLNWKDRGIIKLLLKKHKRQLEKIRGKTNDDKEEKLRRKLITGIMACEGAVEITDDTTGASVTPQYLDTFTTDDLIEFYGEAIQVMQKMV